ncbi:NACHT, LRR and PYD domains-containing protein 12-like isoform X1 [Lates japonicus]
MSEKKREAGAQKRKKQEEKELLESSPSKKTAKLTNYFTPVKREVRTTENLPVRRTGEPTASRRPPAFIAVTGNRTVSAQSGGVANAPQLTGVDVKGNLTVSVNNTYGKFIN